MGEKEAGLRRSGVLLEFLGRGLEFLVEEGLPPLVSVGPAANLRQALNLISTWGISQVPVVDGHDCVGSVTEGLMARVLEDAKILDRPVSEVMGAPFPVVDSDIPIDRLVTMLSKETPEVFTTVNCFCGCPSTGTPMVISVSPSE